MAHTVLKYWLVYFSNTILNTPCKKPYDHILKAKRLICFDKTKQAVDMLYGRLSFTNGNVLVSTFHQ